MTNLVSEKGKSAAVFKIRRDIVGSKSSTSEPTTIIDPDSGDVLFEPEEIKTASLKYFKELLTNREPSKGYEDDVMIKNILHRKRMVEEIENDVSTLTYTMFEDTLISLTREKKNKYKFILKAGWSFKNALFHLFKTVWEGEILPEGWHKTTLLQLWKMKGDFRVLSNHRSIHLKDQIPKAFSHIDVARPEC